MAKGLVRFRMQFEEDAVRKIRKPAIAVLGLTVAATAASCASAGKASAPAPGNRPAVTLQTMLVSARDTRVGKAGGTFRMAIGEPVAIDPYNARSPKASSSPRTSSTRWSP